MDPLTLFLAAVGAGIVSHLGQEDDERSTLLGIRTKPKRCVSSPYPFIQGTFLASDDPAEDDGLWHVTTNITKVLRQGLKSRQQTGAVGLGGGERNIAPDKVSVVVRHDLAMRILEAMTQALRLARGQKKTSAALEEMFRQNDRCLDMIDGHEEFLAEEEDPPPTVFEDISDFLGAPVNSHRSLWNEAVRAQIDDRWPTGEQGYQALVRVEQILTEHLVKAEEMMSEPEAGLQVVGLTAPWHRFAQIDPTELGIVRVCADVRARPEIVEGEMELRFKPEDLTIIGYEMPVLTSASGKNERTAAIEASRRTGLPSPTWFLDRGMTADVFETTNPDIVLRVQPIIDDEPLPEESFFDEELQETGGMVRVFGAVTVELGEQSYFCTWKEKIDPYVEGFLLRTLPPEDADRICMSLLSLASHHRSIQALADYPATEGLYKAIRRGMSTDDLDLSENIGVTKDGRIVAFDL